MCRMKSFSENIGGPKLAAKVGWNNKAILKSVTDKMTINFDVFSPFVEKKIVSDVESSLIVTM